MISGDFCPYIFVSPDISIFLFFLFNSFFDSVWTSEKFDMENDGVIAGVTAGKVIVDCATLSPERMVLESQKIVERYRYD